MLGLDENARRHANHLHVLREVVHLSCGWLALTPRLDAKLAIGDHIYDDARAVSKLERRISELTSENDHPGAPGPEVAALLDRAAASATSDEYLEVAYGLLKPALIAALTAHLQRVDPLLDEPSLRLLTQLLHRQERHVEELPPAVVHPLAHPDLGSSELRPGARRRPTVLPRVGNPARDAFVEIGEGSTDALHDRLNGALWLAELRARTSHENPDMPWDFHVDMARLVWDGMRHAALFDRRLVAAGAQWGSQPVDLQAFRAAYAQDLPGRLAGSFAVAADDDPYLQADAARHLRLTRRWASG